MAIKVLGVIGTTVLPEDESHNQDILLNNILIIPFGHVATYWRVHQRLEKPAEILEPEGPPPWRIATSSAKPFTRWLHSVSGPMLRNSVPRPSRRQSDALPGLMSLIPILRCAI